MKAVIGVDIGSSAIKSVLFAVEGKIVLHSDERALASRVRTPAGHFEEAPITLRDQAFDSIRALTSFAKRESHEVIAIAFTGQMHGGLLVGRDLEPLTSIITWQDKRGNEIGASGRSFVEELRELLPSDPTGVSIHSGFLVSTLYWLRAMKLFPDNAAYVIGIYDWLQSLLVGRAVTDDSSAAAWAMFDPISKSWRKELLEAVGVTNSMLPEVAEPGSAIGNITPQMAVALGLPSAVTVHASIGDSQAAYLGAGATEHDVVANFGTGSQSIWETKRPQATPGTDIRYLRDGRYLACAPTLVGGEAYNILADFFRDIMREFGNSYLPRAEVVRIMDELALRSSSEGMLIDPIFQGSKFRRDDERASILGLTRDNFRAAQVVRALLEGMVEEIARPYFERSEAGHTGLVGAGNAMRRNRALQAIAEARFGLPLRFSPYEEEAAVGAAMLCL